MTSSTIEFKVPVSQIDADVARELKAARDAVQKVETRLIELYSATPRFAAMKDLRGIGGGSYGKGEVYPRIVGAELVCNLIVDHPVKPASGPYFSVDPKTANLLLTGKLLNDVEKRKLLKRMGLEFDDEAA